MKHSWFFLLLLHMGGLEASAKAACAPLKSYQEILACAEARSPEVQSAELEVERSKIQVDAAGQWRNPELSVETFQGKVAGEKRSETDISLGVPIEIGGKLSAKTAMAQGGVAMTEAKLYETRAKVKAQVLLKLHRLRQVVHEQHIATEAIGTFSKLVTQYGSRPGLSPEQQVSLSVYRLSRSDYDLKRSSAADEIVSLESFFQLNLGVSLDEIKSALPQSPKSWPKLGASKAARSSPRQRILEAELEASKAELSLARSEAWPILTVGPSLKMLEEGGRSDSLVGFNMSLPLPVFNLNGGARAASGAQVRLSEAKRQMGLREEQLKREELRKIYEQAVRSLETSISHEEIERRHLESERLFTRGLVPSSLVIEAHRTSFELEKSRHERELAALSALLDLYTLEGTILEVNL